MSLNLLLVDIVPREKLLTFWAPVKNRPNLHSKIQEGWSPQHSNLIEHSNMSDQETH